MPTPNRQLTGDNIPAPPSGPMATQPVITITTITTLVSAVIAGIAMLVNLPPDTERVVLGIVTAAWPVVTAAWTWRRVWSPASTQSAVNDAQSGRVIDVQDPSTWR